MSSASPERRPDPTSSDPGRTTQFSPYASNPSSSSTTPSTTPSAVSSTSGTESTQRPVKTSTQPSTAKWEDPEETGPERARHIVDRFDGAIGLFMLRLVTAAVFVIRGLQKLQHLDVTQQQFAQVGVPYAATMAIVVGACEVAIALALVLGLAVRAAGLGIAIITIGALAYVRWGTGTLFAAGQPGFNGELELVLAGVGIALAGVGGGGFGVDRRFRRR